ncbi:nucleotide-diphospho-sugar transferase [Hyaloraphidium curvatum]|nr:nucleotide-diphospho-sugar transferase [Hyaloraphidium curvatum]
MADFSNGEAVPSLPPPLSAKDRSRGPPRWWRAALLAALLAHAVLLLSRPAWRRPCASIAGCPNTAVPLDTPPALCANESIPRVVHFVFGLRSDAHIDFSLVNYLVIKAAHKHLRPTAMLYHHINLPSSRWFRHARRFLVLAPIKPFTEVFGNPVDHFAHRADIVRLRALQRYGGIYLDMDVLVLRPFDPLLSHDVVMAQEGEGGRIGLCNAVILAKKGAEFIDMWLDSYRSFNQSDWNHHSVILPGMMSRNRPDILTTLGHTRFFWPMWDDPALHELFLGSSWDFRENFGIHLWESKSWEKYLKGLTVRKIMEGTSPFYRILQSLVWDELSDLLWIDEYGQDGPS